MIFWSVSSRGDDRFGSSTDIEISICDVGFPPESGHCPVEQPHALTDSTEHRR
jgi:hypothetical protein